MNCVPFLFDPLSLQYLYQPFAHGLAVGHLLSECYDAELMPKLVVYPQRSHTGLPGSTSGGEIWGAVPVREIYPQPPRFSQSCDQMVAVAANVIWDILMATTGLGSLRSDEFLNGFLRCSGPACLRGTLGLRFPKNTHLFPLLQPDMSALHRKSEMVEVRGMSSPSQCGW